MRVLVAPDKFKGSLTASEVADNLAAGLTAAGLEPDTLPLADGGDGSVSAAVRAGFTGEEIRVHGATGHPRIATIAVEHDTVLVEVADTCGLATLPAGTLAPLTASSRGLGEAIRLGLRRKPARLIIGLGGSASTDGGVGMLAALGHRFLDTNRNTVSLTASTLHEVHYVDSTDALSLKGIDVVIASDVTNPLLGADGAAAVFGPQKGATPEQVTELEEGLRSLVGAFVRSGCARANDIASLPGAGAAGGIGFAAALLGGTVTSGAAFFLDLLGFDTKVAHADAVITGEGRLDRQTLSGKLPTAVAERAFPIPVVAVVGTSDLSAAATPFRDIIAVTDFADTDTSHDPVRTAAILRDIGNRIGRAAPAGVGQLGRIGTCVSFRDSPGGR